ncbi:MAG: protein kinase domain-containing protein [Planctomyces sp.]
MASDREYSELVSRSLSGSLNREQKDSMEAALRKSSNLQAYAGLSGLIQNSTADMAQRTNIGDESTGQGLSPEARDRLKRSVARVQFSRSHAGSSLLETAGLNLSTFPVPTEPGVSSRRMSSEFRFIRQLGEGGLGSVWLAVDQNLNRMVAIKEMNAEAAENPRAWQRFHREAQITGHLEHPSVVPLYQFGTDGQTGQPFYAMRFVGKRTLVHAIRDYHERLDAGKDVSMDQHLLLTAFISVCQAIAYAHSRGVVHRDLKPENVALDNFGQVIVLDWGLARMSTEVEVPGGPVGSSIAGNSAFGTTLAGEVIGTPLYMAPEQAAGDLDSIDERTDVYGLGAILFAMLTGAAPHQASSVRDGVPVKIQELLRIISDNPSPSPRSIRPNLPSGLEMICLRAMERQPHSRYQTAVELADAVQRWMAGRSEHRQLYDNARSEGRELRTSLQTSVRDLERNVRFMASLPAIDEVIEALRSSSDSELQAWRDRLSQIFQGLLRANCDFASVSFCQVTDEKWKELVRAERHSTDYASVRSIPASRLASGSLTPCMKTALDLNPEEVHLSLAAECTTKSTSKNSGVPGKAPTSVLSAGVPVFDPATEELFGFVRIEASLDRLIETEMQQKLKSTAELVILDNDCTVILHLSRSSGRIRETEGHAMTDLLADFQTVRRSLKSTGEFYDEQNHAIHATRVDLIPGRYSLAVVQSVVEKLNVCVNRPSTCRI